MHRRPYTQMERKALTRLVEQVMKKSLKKSASMMMRMRRNMII